MAIINVKGERVTIDCSALISEVEKDIFIFGSTLLVYAIYSWSEKEQVEYISDYVYADNPDDCKEELTEKDYVFLKQIYKNDLKELKVKRNEQLDLSELLSTLTLQSSEK